MSARGCGMCDRLGRRTENVDQVRISAAWRQPRMTRQEVDCVDYYYSTGSLDLHPPKLSARLTRLSLMRASAFAAPPCLAEVGSVTLSSYLFWDTAPRPTLKFSGPITRHLAHPLFGRGGKMRHVIIRSSLFGPSSCLAAAGGRKQHARSSKKKRTDENRRERVTMVNISLF